MEVHFTPEQEAKLTQVARRSGTGTEELVKDAALRLLLQEDARFRDAKSLEQDDRPIWEIIPEIMAHVPPEDMAALPKDGASQIDHYLYGHPKRDQ
jgi:hypothetical protein